jgi:hypothetical protein
LPDDARAAAIGKARRMKSLLWLLLRHRPVSRSEASFAI